MVSLLRPHARASMREAALLALLTLALCAGCAAAPDTSSLGGYPDLSLAETKSPVQLLRNEAASRVAAEVVAAHGTEDHSVSCLPLEEDEDGLIRSWQSIAQLAIVDERAADIDSLVDALAATFVEQGWTLASPGGSALVNSRSLSSDSSSAQIEVRATTTDPDAMYGEETVATHVSIEIVVHGPCVRTDGVDSDEVTSLDP